MADEINDVRLKHPDTQKPTVVTNDSDRQEQKHEHMENAADRLAHKGNKDHQQHDEGRTKFTNVGS